MPACAGMTAWEKCVAWARQCPRESRHVPHGHPSSGCPPYQLPAWLHSPSFPRRRESMFSLKSRMPPART
jgi:hypothetical protein